ncbi:MAG: hypothetical protein JNL32_01560 [Candidatus Kapabacteria bacterium]|nr:hypothetical protein [Candidatus Kapabacteria bacterium]
MRLAERYSAFLDGVFSSYTLAPESLAVYRILFSLHALLFGSIPSLAYLSAFPDSFFTPPLGVAQLFGGFPSLWLCWLLHIATVAACVCMLLGYRTRYASLAYSLLCMTGYSFAFSLGKINHNTGYLFVPLVFAFSDWGARYSADELREGKHGQQQIHSGRSAAVVFCYAFALGWMFFTAGVQKLIGGWLAFGTQATFGWFVNYYYAEHTRQFLAPLLIDIRIPAFWETADWFTVLFECGFVIAAFRRRGIMLFCSFAVVFHFFVLNTLNINSSGFLICYLAFVDWRGTALHRLFVRPVEWMQHHRNITIVAALCITVLITVVGMERGASIDALLTLAGIAQPQMLLAFAFELTGLVIALRYIMQTARRVVKR